ncbi:MAG: hypothetical protein ACRD3C_16940 [Vicinamibacterales bacterium]
MTIRARSIFILGVVGLVTSATVQEARAADPRLVRVVLLRVADRMSLALEMTGEPQKVVLRALSARALEIEAGPVSGFFSEERLAPASDVAFIRQVSIQKHTTTNRVSFVRARVTFDAPGVGNVRVVGRTLYVDFAPVTAPRREIPAVPRLERPQDTPRSQPVTPATVQSPAGNYEQAVRPSLARLAEIGPFLASAAATPSDGVLEAVGGTLAEVEQALRAMDVPQASRPAHHVLLSAVAAARRAVAPEFSGDRVAQARRALALLDAAKSEIH